MTAKILAMHARRWKHLPRLIHDFLLKGTMLLSFLFWVVASIAQGGVVTGKVTDKAGKPLEGVSVMLKDKPTGTSTLADGSFSIVAAKTDVLIFSAVGFASQEITVGDQSAINVELGATNETMDEVVVVGYGKTTKRKSTSSVATVDAAKVASIPAQSISDGLAGRVNGVIMTASSRAPGAKAQISIRGAGSPLFVIDGVIRSPNDFENINPNDIQDMSILKDAAATAVYGSLGGNGAVVILPKKGR